MSIYRQLVPKYLLTRRNQNLMVLFVALFAFVFINVFEPFRSREWMEMSKLKYMLYSCGIILQGGFIVFLSRTAMSVYTCKHLISYGQYALWILCELAVISASFIIWSISLGLQEDVFEAFKVSFINTALLLIIPCTLCIVYLSMKEKEERIKMMEEDRDAAHSNVAKALISFYDGRGGLLLSVARENVLYIEASDNYVCLWYMKNDMPRKAMLRLTMSRVVAQLEGSNIVRCHRSFMVNLEKVRMVRRDKEELFLEMGIASVRDIPVSKTYGEPVMKWILNH